MDAAAVTETELQATTVPAASPARRILVVDDSEANRDGLSRRLARRGYETIAAPSGPAALDLIAQSVFDLVLLDVMMPGMNGLEVLERLRKDYSPTDLPIIMATAKDSSEDVVAALELGANDYVTKPLDFPIVLARVRMHLSLKESVRQVVELEQRLCQRNTELEGVNSRLVAAAERTRRDLEVAARIQESFLPRSILPMPGMAFVWAFIPSEELAGDSLNICPLGGDHVAAYVLDVTGHGVAAALSAVAATRVLSPATDPESLLVRHSTATDSAEPVRPAEVADRLTQKFAWDSDTEQFLTLFYVLLNARTGWCTYISAGHPGAIHLPLQSPAATLDGSGMPIGIASKDDPFTEHSLQLQVGDRVYLYSDGVTEARSPTGELFGHERLIASLERNRTKSTAQSIDSLLEELDRWCACQVHRDDISLLAFERVAAESDGAIVQRINAAPRTGAVVS